MSKYITISLGHGILIVDMEKLKYQIGQIVEGKVTGIQPYGAFVSLDDTTSGLIHISEISDGYVRDIHQFAKEGDLVRVKIIDFDQQNHQARLSLKAISRQRTRNRHPFTHRKIALLPKSKLGFSTIAKQLDQWILKAKEEMKHDEV